MTPRDAMERLDGVTKCDVIRPDPTHPDNLQRGTRRRGAMRFIYATTLRIPRTLQTKLCARKLPHARCNVHKNVRFYATNCTGRIFPAIAARKRRIFTRAGDDDV
jgi:hypothetical protein